MKKPTRKSRERDVRDRIRLLRDSKNLGLIGAASPKPLGKKPGFDWRQVNRRIDKERVDGLELSHFLNGRNLSKKKVVIKLPSKMDFSENQENTRQVFLAIRLLVSVLENWETKSNIPKNAYKLVSINFDQLVSISTSAALVLAAEVSKWNISIKKKLQPSVDRWDEAVYRQFEQLGFFDLFDNKPSRKVSNEEITPDFSFVRYVRGRCGDAVEAKENKRRLKNEIAKLVGTSIDKWTILHSGLTEAVTNVTHHAYPGDEPCEEKSWYLTGSFNKRTREMKIAFYDQGIGIPKSLPTSKIWEKALDFFTKINLPAAKRKKHSELLKAAVLIDRTSTDENDRGKGLQDLLEFIRERGEGSLSILSYYGLYKCWIENGEEQDKAIAVKRPLNGTLIIWNVKL